jgi:hypothetical protein
MKYVISSFERPQGSPSEYENAQVAKQGAFAGTPRRSTARYAVGVGCMPLLRAFGQARILSCFF